MSRIDPSDASVAEGTPAPHASPRAGAWSLLFLYGAMWAIGSLYAIMQGHLLDPSFTDAVAGDGWTHARAFFPSVDKPVAALVRMLGATGLVASLLVMGVAAGPYRRAERWSWYVMWALPIHATVDLATLYGYDAITPAAAVWDVSLLVVALVGLLVPYRSFFDEETEERAPAGGRAVPSGGDA